MPRKYQLPDFLSSTTTQVNYEKWLHGRAVAHVKRDRKRGNTTASNEAYKIAIHRAVISSCGLEFIMRLFLILLVTLSAVGQQSQPPSPTPGKSAHTHQKKTSPENRNTAAHENSTKDLAAAIKQLNTEIAAQNQHQTSTQSESKPPSEGWAKASTIFVTVFTGALAILALLQYLAMRKQAEYMKEGLAETAKAADAAKVSADASRKQVAIADAEVGRRFVQERDQARRFGEQMELAEKQTTLVQQQVALERAWLVISVSGVERLMKPYGLHNSIHRTGFDWKIKNCGRTPAFLHKVGARFHSINDWSELPLDEPSLLEAKMRATIVWPGGMSLGPGDSLERYTVIEGTEPRQQSDFDDVWNSKVIWIVYGLVQYRTILDDTVRETGFCYRWMPGGPDDFLPSPTPANYTKQT